ncbi:MAG: selenocysteine-specific translation elongation factor [Actinobacteria bacterium]|nr:selenocysteine-specific translation elongation factor [Actinomycetota bacterium]
MTVRVVCTAGHVDHGKSSLVRALTGTDPDRLAEEQRRGLTIDLGFAHTRLDAGQGSAATISFVDVPGHVRFLRNMLAGAGSIGACLFVVDAGEGWKPQSEEHLRILELLGHEHGVIALTKVDLVDDEWCDLQELDVREHVHGTFLGDAPIVRVSTVTGEGLDALRRELAHLVAAMGAGPDRRRPRVWIDRSFTAAGSGTVVTGTLTGGELIAGQHVDVVSAGLVARVRAIQVHGGGVERAPAGTRVALNLSGVDHHALTRGDAVVVRSQWRPSARVDASLSVLASLDHDVSRRGAYQAYIGSGEWPVRVRVLGGESIRPGVTGHVRLHLDRELPLLPGDRYVLRERGRDETIGGGEVLDVAPVLPASKARPDRDVDRLVAERGWTDVDELAALTGVQLPPTIGRWVVAPDALTALRDRLDERIRSAGPLGLDLSTLDERERAVVTSSTDVHVDGGRASWGARDDLADHPVVDQLRQGGTSPAEPTGVDRASLRELVRRGLVVERDGLVFHPDAVDLAARTVAALLA